MLDNVAVETINAWREIADSWINRANAILRICQQAVDNGTIQGLEDMVAFAFNAGQHNPNFGGGGGSLPAGKHPVIINKSALMPTLKGDGGKMVLTMLAIDGPAKGGTQTENLNLQNQSAEAMRIANEQLAAIMAVIGKPGQTMQDTNELHDIPFVIEVAPQASKPQYTEIVGVFAMDGRTPIECAQGGGGQQQQNPNPPQNGNGFGGGGGQPQGNGFGGGQPQGGGQTTGFGGGQPQNTGFGGGGGQTTQFGGGQPQGGAGGGQQWSGGGGQTTQQGGGQPQWGAK
jgi:hypothetical protein